MIIPQIGHITMQKMITPCTAAAGYLTGGAIGLVFGAAVGIAGARALARGTNKAVDAVVIPTGKVAERLYVILGGEYSELNRNAIRSQAKRFS